VKINIHEQLYKWRQVIAKEGNPEPAKKWAMKLAGKVLGNPTLYNFMGKSARTALKLSPDSLIYTRFNAWGKKRDLPEVPKESFKEWYKKNRTND
jgi:L-lactate dehydrogenase complex protein LldF